MGGSMFRREISTSAEPRRFGGPASAWHIWFAKEPATRNLRTLDPNPHAIPCKSEQYREQKTCSLCRIRTPRQRSATSERTRVMRGQRFESARRLFTIGTDASHYSGISRRALLRGGDHRKLPPTIVLCRTLDEEVFGVYGEHHSHVAAWIVFLGNAHRLTYALGLHRRS